MTISRSSAAVPASACLVPTLAACNRTAQVARAEGNRHAVMDRRGQLTRRSDIEGPFRQSRARGSGATPEPFVSLQSAECSPGIVSALYLFVYASDYPKTASHISV